MPNTTNFNWTTPADTDLVKDGALAIRTLANGIDTSLVDLKGGTTGQVLAKATNTDLDFSWVAQDDSNAIQNAIIDAKGDLIVGTAADTPARLAVGATNGHVLTVDSAEASGMKWAAAAAGAGNMAQIATGTLSGTSVTISSLSSYTDLVLYLESVTTGGSFNVQFRINNNSGTNYATLGLRHSMNAGTYERDNSALVYTGINMLENISNYNNGNNNWFLKLTNCKNAGFTDYQGMVHTRTSSDPNNRYHGDVRGVYQVSEAVSSFVITTSSGSTFSGGTYYLWGA